jgi:hypothetical protein
VARRKVNQRTARLIIGMMRSIASHRPISPFHLEAADQMEKMLEELLELRKKVKEKQNG